MSAKRELILLVAAGCPTCEVLREKLGSEDGIRILDVAKDQEAIELVAKLNIRAVPTLLLVDGESKKVCLLNEDKSVKCVDGAEESA